MSIWEYSRTQRWEWACYFWVQHCYLLQNKCWRFGFEYQCGLNDKSLRSNTYQFYRKDNVKQLLRTQFWIMDVVITPWKTVRSVKATTSSLVFCIINQSTSVPDCSFNHPDYYVFSICTQLLARRRSDGSVCYYSTVFVCLKFFWNLLGKTILKLKFLTYV